MGYQSKNIYRNQTYKYSNKTIKQIRKSQCYVMDKGYDTEKIHSLFRKEIRADSTIPVKKRARKFGENTEDSYT